MIEFYYAVIVACVLTITFLLGAVWQLRRLRKYLVEYRDVNAQIVESYKSAIDILTERVEFQSATIAVLIAPETYELDRSEKFN